MAWKPQPGGLSAGLATVLGRACGLAPQSAMAGRLPHHVIVIALFDIDH
jgi:hypothetical protein